MKNDKTTEARWNTADPLSYHLLKENRSNLMEYMTEAESFLLYHLKGKKLGTKFRRQHIIDGYVADFVSLSDKLIIEIDGKIHELQKEQDEYRTSVLNQKGFKVIRFSNDEVLHNLDYVLLTIKNELDLLSNKSEEIKDNDLNTLT